MGRRSADDFPFEYLADDRTMDRTKRTESGTRVRDDRPRRRSGSREIEKLLIIAVVLTIVFAILLTAAIMVGAEKKKDRKAETSQTTARKSDESLESGQIEPGGTTLATGPTVQIIDATDPTQLTIVQIG